MLITKHKAELPALIQSLKALPIEGNTLDEIVAREYLRQVTITKLEANAKPPLVPWCTARVPLPIHNTDHPTTVIDNYWGMRLGIRVG